MAAPPAWWCRICMRPVPLTEVPGHVHDRDQPATTGELRALAETGDVEEIRRLNAAWMRVFDLIGHARKQERESAA